MSVRQGANRIPFLAPGSCWGVLLSCLLLAALAPLLMRGWLGDGLPTTPRLETFPELAITWMAREELQSGSLFGEWNPYWFSGFPWLRYLSYPLYYALAAVSVWGGMGLPSVMVLFYLVVTALSGMLAFAYMRHVWHDWRAALVTGVIYELIPFHHFVGVETWIHAAVWPLLPLMFWLIERASNQSRAAKGAPRTQAWGLVGIAIGTLPVISSEYTFFAAPFILAYLVARGVGEVYERRQPLARVLSSWTLTGCVALGISAFFLVPGVLELGNVGIHGKHGAASTFTASLLRDYGATPGLLWYGVLKRFGIDASPDALPGIARSFWGVTWYPGIIAVGLMLAGLAALVRAPRWTQTEMRVGAVSRRQRLVMWSALVGLLISLVASTGPNLSINPFSWLPVWRNLSAFRALLISALCLAILAGVGARWLCSLASRVWGSTWASALITAALLAALVVDYLPSSAAYQSTDAYFTEDERAAYAWLRDRASQGGRFWDVTSRLQHSYLLTYSLSEVGLARYDGYYDNGAPLYTRQQLAATDLPTSLRLHHTRWVLVRRGDTSAEDMAERLLARGYRVAYENDGVRLLEDPNVGGYARFYRQAALDLGAEEDTAFEVLPIFVEHNIALVAGGSLPHKGVPANASFAYLYADSPGEQVPAGQPTALATRVTPATLDVLSPAPDAAVSAFVERDGFCCTRIGVSVTSSGLLTIAESWYPNWRVWVNGVEQPTLRVNGALLGVWLEPGEQRIEFRFHRPWYSIVAAIVTILTWLTIILWWTNNLGGRLKGPEPLTVGRTSDDLQA